MKRKFIECLKFEVRDSAGNGPKTLDGIFYPKEAIAAITKLFIDKYGIPPEEVFDEIVYILYERRVADSNSTDIEKSLKNLKSLLFGNKPGV